MKIIICDDDSFFAETLKKHIEQYEKEEGISFVIYTFSNVETMCEFLQKTPDIRMIFLDIVFSDLDGIQGAKQIYDLNKYIKVVFVSSYVEFAIQGYDVNACGYLLKPVSYDKFKEKMQYVVEKIKQEETDFFYDTTDQGIVLLHYGDIIYFETFGRNVRIHTADQIYIGRKTMKEYEKNLPKSIFCRCHAAYIVNMQYVKKIYKFSLTLKNDTELVISKMKKRNFMDEFTKYVGSMLI